MINLPAPVRPDIRGELPAGMHRLQPSALASVGRRIKRDSQAWIDRETGDGSIYDNW